MHGDGGRRYKQRAEERLFQALSNGLRAWFADFALAVMLEAPVKERHVKDVLKDMKARSAVARNLKGRAQAERRYSDPAGVRQGLR